MRRVTGATLARLPFPPGACLISCPPRKAYHGGRQCHRTDGSSLEPIHDVALPILACAETSLKSVCQWVKRWPLLCALSRTNIDNFLRAKIKAGFAPMVSPPSPRPVDCFPFTLRGCQP